MEELKRISKILNQYSRTLDQCSNGTPLNTMNITASANLFGDNEDDTEVCHTPGILPQPPPQKTENLRTGPLQCHTMHISDIYEYYLVEALCYKAEGRGLDSR
jgi:hypothetical protein